MTRILTTLALSLPLLAQAHEGHGMAGAAHWHASDAWGLLVLAVAVVLLAQAGRRK